MELDMATRNRQTGSYIQLSDGITHYEMDGPRSGGAVVLISGFSVPCFIFDPTFAFLRDAGFRVLRYDHFGRGFSDRPRSLRHDLPTFARQLTELLAGLGIRTASLVGLSMGGLIAAAAALWQPEAVQRLVLIDPVGGAPMPLSVGLRLAKLPLLGELMLTALGQPVLVRAIAADFANPKLAEALAPRFSEQIRFRGSRAALLSTLRSGMLESATDVYEAVGRQGKPVLILWGTQDRTVPFSHSEVVRRAIPQGSFHAIQGSGHLPHYERPSVVNPILKAFLQ